MISPKQYNDFKNHDLKKGLPMIPVCEVIQKLQTKVEALEDRIKTVEKPEVDCNCNVTD